MSEPCGLETSVADWVIEHPQAASLLDRLGIDYACGGRSLEWACHRAGLDPQVILRQLERELKLRRDQPTNFSQGEPAMESRSTFDHRQLVELYQLGPALVREAIAGMTDEELDARPVPGLWSTRQVICHIADFEVVYADRMKRALAEFEPTVFGGDPDSFAASLAYQQRPVDGELLVIEGVRQQMLGILASLTPRDLGRQVRHSEAGLVPLGQLLTDIAAHIPHHLAFVAEKRQRLELA